MTAQFEDDGEARSVAAELLGAAEEDVVEVGVGGTFRCWGTADTVVLIARRPPDVEMMQLKLIAACSAAARAVGVRTPEVLRVGEDPVPHAICVRAHGASIEDDAQPRAALYENLGQQLAALHRVSTSGAGVIKVVDGHLEGRAVDWRAHCDDFINRFVAEDPIESRAWKVRALGDLDPGHWRSLADMIRDHGNGDPVLCHYDNRLPNLPVDEMGVWVLDWDLARLAPLSHELIKLFERPPEAGRADARALLGGYGLARELHEQVIDDSLTALAMDGLEMCVQWVDEPLFHGGIKGWLATIKSVVTSTIG